MGQLRWARAIRSPVLRWKAAKWVRIYLTWVMMRLVGGMKKSFTLWKVVRMAWCTSPTLAWGITCRQFQKNVKWIQYLLSNTNANTLFLWFKPLNVFSVILQKPNFTRSSIGIFLIKDYLRFFLNFIHSLILNISKILEIYTIHLLAIQFTV